MKVGGEVEIRPDAINRYYLGCLARGLLPHLSRFTTTSLQ